MQMPPCLTLYLQFQTTKESCFKSQSQTGAGSDTELLFNPHPD